MNGQTLVVKEIPLDYRFKDIIPLWEEWLSLSPPPEAPYQSSSFFRFLINFSHTADIPHLFGIWNEAECLIGLIPLRKASLILSYSQRRGGITSPRNWINAAYLLGSSLILKPDVVIDQKALFSLLFSKLDSVDAIVVQSAQSSHWKELVCSWRTADKSLFPYTRYGWRECHFMELPPSFEEYEKQFNKKKRYNLNRQIRLLREFSENQLELKVCKTAEDIEDLIRATNETEKFGMKVTLPSKEKLTFLANEGLFLGYILRSKSNTYSVLTGLKHSGSFSVQYFGTAEQFSSFSPGASMLHLAIQHMITDLQIRKIDMGYGNPAHTQSSSNSIDERGYVVLARNNLKMHFLLFSENAIHHLKVGLKKAQKSVEGLKKRFSLLKPEKSIGQ